MSNILNGLSMSDIWSNANDLFSALSPYLTAILGLLLAFFIVNFLVDLLKPKEQEDEQNKL